MVLPDLDPEPQALNPKPQTLVFVLFFDPFVGAHPKPHSAEGVAACAPLSDAERVAACMLCCAAQLTAAGDSSASSA